MSLPSATDRPAPIAVSLQEYLHACPLCRASRLVEYCRVPSLFRAGEFIRYDRCLACDIAFRNPRMPASSRMEGYRDHDYSATLKALTPNTLLHYRYLVRRLVRLLPPGKGHRVLDFGCGAGAFLAEAKNAGLQPYGLEVNRALASHVTETYAIPVHCGQITDAHFPDHFDLIVSLQVFEHLMDPAGTLLHLTRHLADRGLVLIEVPNLRDFRERLRRGATMDDSHLFYFNRRSLSCLLHACGFEVVEIHEGMRPYRLLGAATARLPPPAYRAIERAMAAIQLKTVLAVIAISKRPASA